MLLPRILAPVRAATRSKSTLLAPSSRLLDAVRIANGSSTPSPILSFVRHATHQSQGRANGAKDGHGKRLGAKKTGGEYVIPGNIIFRQRGTAWFAGENCAMGRDHCIYATESGYVRYYRDPLKHPDRQYIGVVFEKHETLPYPVNAARRRRLNMVAVQREPELETADGQLLVNDVNAGDSTASIGVPPRTFHTKAKSKKGYVPRESNWDIGRMAERAEKQFRVFTDKERYRYWKKGLTMTKPGADLGRGNRGAGKKPSKSKRKR